MPDNDSFDESLLKRVDEIADKFDTAWQAALQGSPPPSVDDHASEIDEAHRSELVRELVRIDIDYRHSRGETPIPQDYRKRFEFLDEDWLRRVLAGATDTEFEGQSPAPGNPPTPRMGVGAPLMTHVTRIRCPHCQCPIQLVDDRPEAVLCPSCGSSFRLRDTRMTSTVGQMRQLGKFQLLERRGLGAFGAVWKARDTVLDKIVALKIPHAGSLDGEADRQRFYREARAAAQLRHPGIVAVHEVAELETEAGKLPAIVSDFVDGVTLRELLEARRLTFRESAVLMVQLAEALDFAHSMGVVHRDIKPANIMLEYPKGLGLSAPLDANTLTSSGQVSGPKTLESLSRNQESADRPSAVSDSRPPLTDSSVRLARPRPMILDFGLALRDQGEATMTVDGQRLGTPAYMSPEQAAGQSHRVDARSDVYTLGVILYELLCGELPFRGSTHAIYRQILNDEPQALRRLNDNIPRDLETICLKCSEKEPVKRFPNAAALADELRRFLDGQPIHARPVGNVERLWRWCRRNPRVAALTSMIVLLVTGIAVGSTVGMFVVAEQKRQTENARLAEQKQLAEVERQKQLVEGQRDRAERNFRFARDAVSRYYTDVSETTLLNVPRMQPLRRKLLNTAAEFYEKFTDELGDDRTLLSELGLAYRRLAAITRDIGSKQQAIEILERSRDTFQKLITENPDNIQYRREFATTLSNLAVTYNDTAQVSKAESAYRDSLRMRQEIVDSDPKNAGIREELSDSWNNLGVFYDELKQFAQAEPCYESALKIRESLAADYPDNDVYRHLVATTYGNLIMFYQDTKRLKLAEDSLQKCLVIRQALVDDFPNNLEYQNELGKLLNNSGIFFRQTGRPKDTERFYQQAIELRDRLTREHPDVTDYQSQLADSYHNLGVLFRLQGRIGEAQELYEKAMPIWQKLASDDPSHPEWQSDLARGHNNFGIVFLVNDQLDRAEQEYRKAIEIRERLVSRYPDVSNYRYLVSGSYFNLGNMFAAAGQFDRAVEPFRKAVELRNELVEKQPHSMEYRGALNSARLNLAAAYLETQKTAEALAITEQVITDLEDLMRQNPGVTDHPISLGIAYANRGNMAQAANDLEGALGWYNRSVEVAEPVVVQNERNIEARHSLAAGLQGRAEVSEKLGRFDTAIRDLERANEFTRPDNQTCLVGLAECYTKLHQPVKAEPYLRELVAFRKKRMGTDSKEYAESLSLLGLNLINQKKPAEAEPLLRECLLIREKTQPDAWATFNTQSLLGGSLLGQKKYAEAEPLLLAGYEGMTAREAKIPAEAKSRLSEAIQSLVELYDAWGKKEKADEWRKKLPPSTGSHEIK